MDTTTAPPIKETKAQRVERLKREKNPWEGLDDLRRFIAEWDVVPGPWTGSKPDGNHNLIWIHRGKYRSNTLANVNTFGLTGRDPQGSRLLPGTYRLQLVAWPVLPGKPTTVTLRFAIR